jgi:hypothetical protein
VAQTSDNLNTFWQSLQVQGTEILPFLIMIECIMLYRFLFESCFSPRRKQIKSLLKFCYSIQTKKVKIIILLVKILKFLLVFESITLCQSKNSLNTDLHCITWFPYAVPHHFFVFKWNMFLGLNGTCFWRLMIFFILSVFTLTEIWWLFLKQFILTEICWLFLKQFINYITLHLKVVLKTASVV